MSIAKQVSEEFEKTGQLAIPDKMKAIAFSYGMSSDPDDKRRLIAFVFPDGSDLSIDTRGKQISASWSPAGSSPYSID